MALAVVGTVATGASSGGHAPRVVDSATVESTTSAASTAPPATTPTVIYIEHPTVSEWLASSVSMPSTVEHGSTFTISGTCPNPGDFAGALGYTTPDPNPNSNPVYAAGFVAQQTMSQIDPTGRFSFHFQAADPPGTYYFQVSCLAEGWISDELSVDTNGNLTRDFYTFPLVEMRKLTITAEGNTLPPTQ